MTGSEQAPQSPKTPLSRRARRAAAGDDGRRLNAVPFLIAGVLVVLMILSLLWLFLWRDSGGEDEAGWEWVENPVDGVHARDVPADDWEAGWCLTNFVDEESPADVVDCDQTYDRQVMLRRNISDGSYPGDTTVAQTAHQWCRDELELNRGELERADFALEVELWHPTENTWGSGDRMVSCFLTRPDGAGLSGHFLAETDDDDEDDDDDRDPETDESDDADGEDETVTVEEAEDLELVD